VNELVFRSFLVFGILELDWSAALLKKLEYALAFVL
jgi:hypothetical protein